MTNDYQIVNKNLYVWITPCFAPQYSFTNCSYEQLCPGSLLEENYTFLSLSKSYKQFDGLDCFSKHSGRQYWQNQAASHSAA